MESNYPLSLEAAYRYSVNTEVNQIAGEEVEYPLYIGSIYFDPEELMEMGVTAIINATDEDYTFVSAYSDYDFDYLWLDSEDDGSRRGDEYWSRALEWAEDVLSDGGVLFVHCHAGSRRSSSVVYLILRGFYGLGKYEAGNLLRESRPQVSSRYWKEVDDWLEYWREA